MAKKYRDEAQPNRYKFDLMPFRDDNNKLLGFSLSAEFYDMPDEDTFFLLYLDGSIEIHAGNNLIESHNLAQDIISMGQDIIRHKKAKYSEGD